MYFSWAIGHYSLPFVRYSVQNNILLLSYPGHSTHLLKPLNVVLCSPLQKPTANLFTITPAILDGV